MIAALVVPGRVFSQGLRVHPDRRRFVVAGALMAQQPRRLRELSPPSSAPQGAPPARLPLELAPIERLTRGARRIAAATRCRPFSN
jgi:hypothetical protein